MTVQSYTGIINTEGEFETLATSTEITFVQDSKYYIYVKKGIIKIADAEIPFIDKEMIITQGSEDIYLKTDNLGTDVVVLEFE